MDNYQHNLSDKHQSMFDIEGRIIKAKKTIAVLKDYLNNTDTLTLLDIGCSSGIMTNEYAKFFKKVIGIDIDSNAVEYAKLNLNPSNVEYFITPIEESKLRPESFDAITCSHIYEHVPSSEVLMKKIFELLKPGGVCYFAAGNRFKIIEAHYKLPFLSWLPKKLANVYIKIFTNENEYYEKHLSLKKLKALVRDFEVTDYTLKIIKDPKRYSANEMLKEKTIKYFVVNFLSKFLYFLFPTYIWILRKPVN